MRVTAATLCVLLFASVSSLPSRATPRLGGAAIDAQNERQLVAAEALFEHNPAQALAVLRSVHEERRTLDRARFLRVRGLVHLRLQHHAAAADDLQAARSALGVTVDALPDAVLDAAIARAEFGRGACKPALSALSRLGDRALAAPDTAVIKVECLWLERAYVRAATSLERAIALTPNDGGLRLLRARFALEGNLPRAAAADLLVGIDCGASLMATLPLAQKTADQDPGAAAPVWQALAAAFPDDSRAAAALASASAGQDPGDASAWAQRALRASPDDDTRVLRAAEALRVEGRTQEALRLNAQASGPDKLKQRVALLVDDGAWERVVALRASLAQAGLLKDDAVRYAIAYAHYAIGELGAAEAMLDGIADAQLFVRASELRAVITGCQAAEERCPG